MILVENEVVITVMDSYEQKENGKLINGCIYPMGDVVNVVTPAEVVPQKYCYNATQGFYLNPNYVPYVSPEQQFAQMQEEIDLLTLEIATLKGV